MYRLTLSECSEITNLVSGSSAISSDTADQACAMLDAAATPSSSVVTPRPPAPQSQTHSHAEMYLTKGDWAALRDPRVLVSTKVRREREGLYISYFIERKSTGNSWRIYLIEFT